MHVNDSLYGSVEFTGPAERVIRSAALQRLEGVHQNGGVYLVNPDMDTTRFEHTVGVAILCKRFGASDSEVIAALLHDVGHTAFSHVADHVFEREDQTFHEDQLGRVVRRYSLDDLLDAHGYEPERIFDTDRFAILERDLPDVCADRLDYQLRDVYNYGLIDRQTVDEILRGLAVEGEQLVAANRETARSLVDVSLLLQRQVYFNETHEAVNMVLADLIETALDRGVLCMADLFRTDRDVLSKLRSVREFSSTLDAIEEGITVERDGPEARFSITRKRRTMDPLVAGTGDRISELDAEVERKIARFRSAVSMEQRYSITLPT